MKIKLALCALGMVVMTWSGPVRAEVEEAQATIKPWSGYWWPHYEGRMIRGPLGKYDQLTGKKAAQWERSKHPSGRSVPKWHGYCHAWSASAVTEKEPRKGRSAQGGNGGRGTQLSIGDQKGLLTVSHTQDVANSYGERNNGGGDPQDIRPDVLWRLLRQYIKKQGTAIILDTDAGTQVWNYPVYSYRIAYNSQGGDNYRANMTLWMADDSVPPDYVGVKVRKQTYQFTCKMQGGSVVMGSGQWTGASGRDHPDFAWYPNVTVAENPEVDYQQVRKYLGLPAGGGSNTDPATPEDPDPMNTTDPPNPMNPTNPPTNGGSPGIVDPASPDDPDMPVRPSRPGTPPPARRPHRVVAVSPLELVSLVANKTSSFPFDITVDKFDGGVYSVGESYLVRGSSKKAGYLYLFLITPPMGAPMKDNQEGKEDPNHQGDKFGNMKLLFPIGKQDNRIPANDQFQFPEPKASYEFITEEPMGVHRIKAIVTSKPLILTCLDNSDQVQQQDFGKPGPGKPGKKGQGQEFRLPPTQREQIQQFLMKKSIKSDELEEFTGVKPQQVLEEFAQDEVAFRVEGGGGKEKPKVEEKPKPKKKVNK